MSDPQYQRESFLAWYDRNIAVNTQWPRAYICYVEHPGTPYVPAHQHRFGSVIDATRWKRTMLKEFEAL